MSSQIKLEPTELTAGGRGEAPTRPTLQQQQAQERVAAKQQPDAKTGLKEPPWHGTHADISRPAPKEQHAQTTQLPNKRTEGPACPRNARSKPTGCEQTNTVQSPNQQKPPTIAKQGRLKQLRLAQQRITGFLSQVPGAQAAAAGEQDAAATATPAQTQPHLQRTVTDANQQESLKERQSKQP
jgi:hypothetical protein